MAVFLFWSERKIRVASREDAKTRSGERTEVPGPFPVSPLGLKDGDLGIANKQGRRAMDACGDVIQVQITEFAGLRRRSLCRRLSPAAWDLSPPVTDCQVDREASKRETCGRVFRRGRRPAPNRVEGSERGRSIVQRRQIFDGGDWEGNIWRRSTTDFEAPNRCRRRCFLRRAVAEISGRYDGKHIWK